MSQGGGQGGWGNGSANNRREQRRHAQPPAAVQPTQPQGPAGPLPAHGSPPQPQQRPQHYQQRPSPQQHHPPQHDQQRPSPQQHHPHQHDQQRPSPQQHHPHQHYQQRPSPQQQRPPQHHQQRRPQPRHRPLPAAGHALPTVGQHLRDHEAARWRLGLTLTIIGCLIGLLLNLTVFIVPRIGDPSFAHTMDTLGRSAMLAYVPVMLYLFIPWLVDRYDPEPWWALAGVFLWGALFATGTSAVINTIVGSIFGKFVGSAISAPIFEELTKGMAIWGMVVFLRREFDGVVDGIIYGTFVAIGFAATENIVYYARFHGNVGNIFILRGILTPWLHPLFTSMTGIGFGLGREHGSSWAKWVFPLMGYALGVFLHAWWNGIPQLFPEMGAVNLIFGILMAGTFFLLIVVLVYRKGKTIKKHLEDEVLIGTITQEEYYLITSYGGRLRARLSWRGKLGAEFVAAGARLALSKWHSARAMKGRKVTVSMDFILPLRNKLKSLREQMIVKRRR